MQTRRFGKTGHRSTLAILGGFAFSQAKREETDALMKSVIQAGVNHIDIAPSYGHAEEQLGPWLARERERFFLGCKTTERRGKAAAKELRESLINLQVEQLDLYQLHAVATMEELDQAMQSGGAIEALVEARDLGLTRFLGITTHGIAAPNVLLEALARFDFDSVLFPINFVQYGIPEYRRACEELLAVCAERDVGTMIIKSIAKGPWGEKEQDRLTWYEPFEEQEQIKRAVNFALSQPVTGICTAGDPVLLPRVLQACEDFEPMSAGEQEAMIEKGRRYQPLFV